MGAALFGLGKVIEFSSVLLSHAFSLDCFEGSFIPETGRLALEVIF